METLAPVPVSAGIWELRVMLPFFRELQSLKLWLCPKTLHCHLTIFGPQPEPLRRGCVLHILLSPRSIQIAVFQDCLSHILAHSVSLLLKEGGSQDFKSSFFYFLYTLPDIDFEMSCLIHL